MVIRVGLHLVVLVVLSLCLVLEVLRVKVVVVRVVGIIYEMEKMDLHIQVVVVVRV